jgi:hypothetical protein
MRHQSNKFRQRANEARPVREGLIAKHAKCMICDTSPAKPVRRGGTTQLSNLCCHEIANGPDRQKALDQPQSILVLCAYCNLHEVTDKGKWPEPRQLAVLLEKSIEDYDLQSHNQLVNPRAPNRITQDEVDDWHRYHNELRNEGKQIHDDDD